MAETLTVDLGDRSYPILLGRTLQRELHECVSGLRSAGRPVAVVTDSNVAAHQGPLLTGAFSGQPQLVLEPGEATKSLEHLGRVWDFLAEHRISRGGALFAVGGGVVGDLAGFAAATYLRGIEYYQVPTTLLAMVDSSVGGKTGINLAAGKNLAGAFHQPRSVFVATEVLRTLPSREFAAGMAEVIKTGLLGDAELFGWTEEESFSPEHPRLAAAVRRCCERKAAVVRGDERELASSGGRALLNLGHTFGHAIEQATRYSAYLHGEAVAVGLVAAARLSRGLGLLEEGAVARVEGAVARANLPTRLREPISVAALMQAVGRDKKVRQGLPRFVVLRSIGEADTQDRVDPELVESVWREVGAG